MSGGDPRYEIEPRPEELGGGWRLRLIEGWEERGSVVFPAADEEASRDAYNDAVEAGEHWLARRRLKERGQ